MKRAKQYSEAVGKARGAGHSRTGLTQNAARDSVRVCVEIPHPFDGVTLIGERAGEQLRWDSKRG